MKTSCRIANPVSGIRGWRAWAASLVPSALAVFLVVLFAAPSAAWSAAGEADREYTRIPNGIARASSSGDNRPPSNAFDRLQATFWRNRTNQTGMQYLEMDFNGPTFAIARITLTFGDHYPRDYRFCVKRNGTWQWTRAITGNTLGSRRHVWPLTIKNVQAVRIYCLRYSADDYFSVREMVIER